MGEGAKQVGDENQELVLSKDEINLLKLGPKMADGVWKGVYP